VFECPSSKDLKVKPVPKDIEIVVTDVDRAPEEVQGVRAVKDVDDVPEEVQGVRAGRLWSRTSIMYLRSRELGPSRTSVVHLRRCRELGPSRTSIVYLRKCRELGPEDCGHGRRSCT